MSPSSLEINGPRPAPLKISKHSHQIQKTTSSTASHQQRQQPIIIYIHSPKVIHTQARDFMALVQKLTGLSRADHDDNTEDDDDNNDSNNKPKSTPPPPGKKGRAAREQPGLLSEHDDIVNPAAAATFGFDYQPFGIAEIPMFTPSPTDHFFFSPKSLYRYSLTEF